MKGVDLRDASQPIMLQLRTHLKLAIKHSTPAELNHYREAFLWMLFAGAQHEVRCRNSRNQFEDDGTSTWSASTWFSMMLAKQAKDLGVTKWPDARKVLARFLYTDYHEPHAETWYENVVSTYDRRDTI